MGPWVYLVRWVLIVVGVIGGALVVSYSSPDERVDGSSFTPLDPTSYLARISSSRPVGSDRYPTFPGTPLFEGDYIPAGRLTQQKSCGLAGCHPDVTAQWNRSAHHFASFNNPLYRASVDYTRLRKGDEGVRWCAGCHDPVLLASGSIDGEVTEQTPHADDGVTCLTCHNIKAVQDLTGNGRYVLHAPDVSSLDEEFPLSPLIYGFIRALPRTHRETFLKPVHQAPELCSACHRVGLHPAQNGYKWLRGQDQFGGWQNGGASGRVARSFYTPKAAMRCQDCHMPLVDSQDAGNDQGKIRSHTFPGANVALASVTGQSEQVADVMKFLVGSLRVDLFAVRFTPSDTHPEKVMIPAEGAQLPPGQRVTVDVVVRNLRVGHAFPEGVLDNKEVWLEVWATDPTGAEVFRFGGLDDQGELRADTHRYGAILLDEAGNAIDKRNIGDFRIPLFRRVIGPGQSDVARMQFTVPKDSPMLTLHAQLRYRKSSPFYNRWAFAGVRDPSSPLPPLGSAVDSGRYLFDPNKVVPPVPIVDIATAQLTLGVGAPPAAASAVPLEERWYDYGVGLLVQRDLPRAGRAFDELIQHSPGFVSGYVGRARVALADGDPGLALTLLEKADEVHQAADPAMVDRIAALRGEAQSRSGDYPAAIATFRQVLTHFPMDRSMWVDLGYALFQNGEDRAALVALEEVFRQDPDDVGGWGLKVRVLRSLGQNAEADQAQAIFDVLKEDTEQQGARAIYLESHPEMRWESRPAHEHGGGEKGEGL